MPDFRRVPVRQLTRLNRLHAGQSVDPTLTRKGKFAHPGSLFIGFGGFVFFAYVFNLGGVQTRLDNLFSGLDANLRSHNGEVARFVIAALPYLVVAFGALALFMLLSMLGRGARSLTRANKLSKRKEMSVNSLAEAAAVHGISTRVARDAYNELLPLYNNMRIALSDRLSTTLGLKPIEISELYGNLLRRSDRQRRVGDDGARIESVLDLMQAVERSKPRSLSQSRIQEREAPPSEVRKKPSLAAWIKASLLHSIAGKAKPTAAPQRKPEISLIKPLRLPVRELDMKPKSMPPRNESSAAS
jgi:hypothetical protein